jgi:aldehyde:ferredoxin oxidoreductase
MTTLQGNGRKYLVVDLTAEKWDVRLLPLPLYEKYPGGEGLAVYLWSQFCGVSSSFDPLGPENPLCLAAGALAGTKTQCSNWISIVTKSPLTGALGTYSGNSPFAGALKRAGWDAVVVVGSARRPMVVRIGTTEVEFKTSERLIGLNCRQTVEALQLTPEERALTIGQAGENRVPFATVMSEGFPVGRGGAGAVLGSKRIKAVVVREGDCEIMPVDFALMDRNELVIRKRVKASRFLAAQHVAGSLERIDHAKTAGFAAVKNFSNRTDLRLRHIGAKECARRYALENNPCEDCPFDCHKTIHLPSGVSAPLVGFEEAVALGPNLENYDLSVITTWYDAVLTYGLDPLSTGNVLGWAMEAQQRNVIDWAPMLAWGQTDGISQVIEQIALRKGPGAQLSLGVKELAARYGMAEAACHVRGLEMPPYDPRGAWGEALSLSMGEQYPLIPEIVLPLLKGPSMRGKLPWVRFQRKLLAALSTLGYCPPMAVAVLFEHGWANLMRFRPLAALLVRFPSIGCRVTAPTVFAKVLQGLTGVSLDARAFLAMGNSVIELKQALDAGMHVDPRCSLPLRFLVDPESNHPDEAVVNGYGRKIAKRLVR